MHQPGTLVALPLFAFEHGHFPRLQAPDVIHRGSGLVQFAPI